MNLGVILNHSILLNESLKMFVRIYTIGVEIGLLQGTTNLIND